MHSPLEADQQKSTMNICVCLFARKLSLKVQKNDKGDEKMTKDGTHRKTETYIVVNFHPVGAEEGHGANARRKRRRGKKKERKKEENLLLSAILKSPLMF